MENIVIYPKNEKQKCLLQSLLREMKVRFEMKNTADAALLSEDEFYEKIDKSLKQAEEGETKVLSQDRQRELLDL